MRKCGWYDRKNPRLTVWDYRRAGWYFVTICTKHRVPTFGAVSSKVMRLSRAGFIAEDCWRRTPSHSPQVSLDEYVIMPDHIHGILVLNARAGILHPTMRTGRCPVPTADSDRSNGVRRPVGPLRGSLPQVLGTYKSAVTYSVRQNGHPDFAGNPGFTTILSGTRNRYMRSARIFATIPRDTHHVLEGTPSIANPGPGVGSSGSLKEHLVTTDT